MGRGLMMLVAGVILAAPLAASAQETAPACGPTQGPLPVEFGGWPTKVELASADRATGLAAATLRIGQAVRARLHPTPTVAYLVQPEKPGGSVSRGGMFALTIDRAGTYAIALGSGAWIDVLKDGAPVESAAHGRGPACSTIRKVVDFSLTPGRYVIQVSANAETELELLVSLRPSPG